MAKIFITGSADGLGLLAAKALTDAGHSVVMHARNQQRKNEIAAKVTGVQTILTADLSDTNETIALAKQVNELGKFDAVIHNAGVYNAPAKQIVAVNVLAPYILTCLIKDAERLIYLSSGMHLHGTFDASLLEKNAGNVSYSDSKLYVLMLALAVARKRTDVYSNAVNPGWVPTKMGGRGAPDNLQKGYETQTWLATSNEAAAKVSGNYFFHKKQERFNAIARDVAKQELLLSICKELTGVS